VQGVHPAAPVSSGGEVLHRVWALIVAGVASGVVVAGLGGSGQNGWIDFVGRNGQARSATQMHGPKTIRRAV
jgi:hypothetical protein